jgi:heterodisulfide reductase subunit A
MEDKEVILDIDGKKVKAKEGMTVLEAARSASINIPTLCYHPALTAFGACRLCIVEITSNGRSRVATSCVYPVEEELIVRTRSDRVLRDRRMLIELLLARAPKAKVIQDLAREYGIEKTRFKTKDPEELCILCGLCTRICKERMGESAINFISRGVERKVGPPFEIQSEVCAGCGACVSVCPTGAIKLEDITKYKITSIPSEFEMGLGTRVPIYIPFPQAVPHVPVIDRETCMHFLTGKCKTCEVFCEPKAIDFEQKDEIIEIEVGNVIVATGYHALDPGAMSQYGYGRYDNVITGLEFERLCNATGPTGGNIRLKDGSTPRSVALVHCVGSRDGNYHDYCSRVCCMYALKHSHLIKEKVNSEVYQIFTDIRCFGKDYEDFYQRLVHEGVNFVRGKVQSIVSTNGKEADKGRLSITAQDPDNGKTTQVIADMVVLCTAIEAQQDAEKVAHTFSISRKADGFFLERHPKLDPVATMTDGIYVVGCCQGPKDIPDTVSQASAAAGRVLALITKGKVELEASTAVINEADCSGCRTCNLLCPYNAITFDGEKRVSIINEALCKGCGSCVASCPSEAITLKHFTTEQIVAELEGMLA